MNKESVTPTMGEVRANMPLHLRLEMDRAEIAVLADAFAGGAKARHFLSLIRFPFQDYRFTEFMPDGPEIEIERVIWPFLGVRHQALMCWREIYTLGRFRTVVNDARFIRQIVGQAYGWGWPIQGMVIYTYDGLRFALTRDAHA